MVRALEKASDLLHPVTIEDRNPGEVSSELEKRLRAFNEALAGPLRTKHVVLAVRDETGRLIAGLTAEIFWNALYIDILWVDEDHRRRGYGAALLRRAEDAGRAESCDVAYLSTFDFQAPGFYERYGYDVLGELQDVPPGSRSRWLCKKLRRDGV
jgi:GNAT superfamily N-acetyltransferase